MACKKVLEGPYVGFRYTCCGNSRRLGVLGRYLLAIMRFHRNRKIHFARKSLLILIMFMTNTKHKHKQINKQMTDEVI